MQDKEQYTGERKSDIDELILSDLIDRVRQSRKYVISRMHTPVAKEFDELWVAKQFRLKGDGHFAHLVIKELDSEAGKIADGESRSLVWMPYKIHREGDDLILRHAFRIVDNARLVTTACHGAETI